LGGDPNLVVSDDGSLRAPDVDPFVPAPSVVAATKSDRPSVGRPKEETPTPVVATLAAIETNVSPADNVFS
jgi:hypothetical protein